MEGGAFCSFFFFFLIIGVAALAIFLARQHGKKVDAAWDEAARRLGLRYEPGGWGRHRRMAGLLEGNAVTVAIVTRGSGKNSKTYTRYEVACPRELGLGLRLTREGFFSGVAKFFGSQDIQVGDATFDQDVIVKGRSPQRVVEFLTPARRLRIHRFLMSHPGGVVDDNGVTAEVRGATTDPAEIVGNVRRMAHLAAHLAGEQADDAPLARAMAAQREGRLEEALEVVHTAPVVGEVEPVEARVIEGEILYLGGRYDEAAQAFEKAQAAAPADPDVRQWAQQARSAQARFQQGVHRADEEVARNVRAAPMPPQRPPASPAPDAAAACAELFDPKLTSSDTNRLFEERYRGAAVKWSGKLVRADTYSFDLVFGSKPGTKAVVELHEVAGGMFGGRKVQAIVQLPPEAADALRTRMGQSVPFEGRLVRCDGFMRNLYVADGVLT